MWNERLNEKFTNRLIGYCQNKRVVVVGNAISLFANKYGNFIDSFDVVVRMGKGVPRPEFREFLGVKTDVWVGSILRAHNYRDFQDAPFKVINITQIPLYDDNRANVSIPKIFYSKDFQLYRDYFLIGNYDMTRSLIRHAYGRVNKDERMSQGAMVLSYFTNIIKSYKELHVIGFDFFEGKLQYKLPGENEVNEVSSFHLPIPTTKGQNSNPHVGLYNPEAYVSGESLDKKYIEKLITNKKIIFHKMENIKPPPENIELIVSKCRPKATLVTTDDNISEAERDNEISN